jgi:hypothetical protein
VRDGDAGQQLPELLVVVDRQQHMPRDDPVLLVVPRRVPRELKDLKRREETRRIKDSASSAGQVGGMGGVH